MVLTSAPVLVHPNFSKKFYIQCDASDYGIGAVLVQLDEEGLERPIAFMSKKLNAAQRNYSVTERECLAAIEAIERFRCYVELQDFEVITDHSSLVWLMRQQNLSGRLARWALKLQGYNFQISHRKGKNHLVPDALSRMYEGEISSIGSTYPLIDLESTHFEDEDYKTLKERIRVDQEKLPDLKVVDKFVYIRTEHATGDEGQELNAWKLWVPLTLRKNVLEMAHDSKIASHGGTVKTTDLIRRHLYWPGLVKDVREYIRKCDVCKETKAPNFVIRPPMGKQSISCRPFQKLYIDLLGPYPRSKKGNIGLLIVLDHFSKFHWLCPLRKFTSAKIREFLVN